MKEAKLKFKPANFEIINPGDYVFCKVSGKKIMECGIARGLLFLC